MQQFGLNEKSQGIFKAKLANMTCVCVCARNPSVLQALQCVCPIAKLLSISPVHWDSISGSQFQNLRQHCASGDTAKMVSINVH